MSHAIGSYDGRMNLRNERTREHVALEAEAQEGGLR